MKRKKWVNKVIALLLAAIMIVPSSLGTVAYAQEPEVSSEQTQTIQNADENISEASEQETTDASQKEQEKKETQDTQGTESKETQKEDSYEVKLSKADNGLLSFPISEDDLVKADVENSTQSILDASEEDVEYESKDSYEENTEVKVQTSADYGYELDKVELEDKSGEVLQELSVDEEGIATFTMPEENVKVAATFKEIPESVIEDAEIDLQTTASDYEIATRAAGTKSIYLNVPGNKIWYGRYNTRYYTTNEGQVAYCMNPLLKTPGAGWYTGSLISDGSSRKAFYYAYGGPGYSQFVNRYGWIWNGVRDLEYAYSHVILSYTYAKYALHNNSQANYAFYGLPNSTKNYLINKANQMQAMGGIPSGYAVYYFNTSYNHQPMAFQVNNVATLSLRKSSSNTDITNGNSCYSLANAKYGVYSNAACTSQVSTFTTNANGTSNSINLEPGTYYVKEISAPEGYYIDNTVKTVSLSSGENKVVSFTDKPMDDPAAIVIQKKDKYTGNTIKGKKTLAGAQFTIKYYDGFYDRNNLPAKATRTWVIETKERTRPNGSKVYQAGLSDTYKVGGDNFYKVDGAITIPRGTITIQETKAPDGYRNDLSMTDSKGNSTVNGVYLAQVTKPGDLSTLMGGQTFEGSDSPVRADIKLTKINGTNNNTMANIPFKITNLETKESHTIYTGSNGVYDSSLIKKSLNTNTDKAGAGVWFGDTSILSDDEGSFEYGSYSIEELECKENDGKILYKGTFKIDNNTGGTLDLGKIINNSIEVKTYAADNTSGNNNTAFIQQGGIFNYTTGQLTYGKAFTCFSEKTVKIEQSCIFDYKDALAKIEPNIIRSWQYTHTRTDIDFSYPARSINLKQKCKITLGTRLSFSDIGECAFRLQNCIFTNGGTILLPQEASRKKSNKLSPEGIVKDYNSQCYMKFDKIMEQLKSYETIPVTDMQQSVWNILEKLKFSSAFGFSNTRDLQKNYLSTFEKEGDALDVVIKILKIPGVLQRNYPGTTHDRVNECIGKIFNLKMEKLIV